MALPKHAKMSFEGLLWLINLIRDLRYSILGAQMVVVYEWLDNLEDEVRLIHGSKWTSVKVLYLICRYYPLVYWPAIEWALIGVHPPNACVRIVRGIYALFIFLTLPAQAVLFMRTYAFSMRNKLILVLLSLCYAFVLGSHIWLLWIDIPIFTLNTTSEDRSIGCFPDYRITASVARRVVVANIAILAMNFISLLIVVLYCWRSRRRRSSLGRYFMRQGLYSFAYYSLLSLINLALFFKAPHSRNGIGLSFTFILPDILACRLILQLRDRAVPSDKDVSRLHSRLVRDALNRDNGYSISDHWVVEESG